MTPVPLGPASSPSQAVVDLEVWADIACPWCYIGHRHLDAVVPRDAAEVRVVHRPYQLQPELPERGLPMRPFFEAKFGGSDVADQMFDRVRDVGHEVGIAFDFEAMPVAPNTVLAHRALALLDAEPQAQRSAVEALFAAYFELGLDITDPEVVIEAVSSASGWSAHAVRAGLDSDGQGQAVAEQLQRAMALGIQAVPTFVAAGRLAVQGAQPPSVLAALLDQARDQASA